MVYLTRKEHFNAAHRLYNPAWSDEKNFEMFGKCSGKNFHGHNYDLYVTVKGVPSRDTGILINLKDMSALITRHVLDKIDHKNINLEVEFMKGKIPSTENLTEAIFKELQNRFSGCDLHSVKLYETENNFAEYFGE